LLPPLAFIITKRLCLSLQRSDRELVLHGTETGRLVRMPSGEFVEIHEPISPQKRFILTSHEQSGALELPDTDSRGVKRPGGLKNKLRVRLSKAHAVGVPKVTSDEIKEIEHH